MFQWMWMQCPWCYMYWRYCLIDKWIKISHCRPYPVGKTQLIGSPVSLIFWIIHYYEPWKDLWYNRIHNKRELWCHGWECYKVRNRCEGGLPQGVPWQESLFNNNKEQGIVPKHSRYKKRLNIANRYIIKQGWNSEWV